MAEAYIVDAVRSPTGRRKGGLAHVHGADLGAHVLKAIVERNGIPDNEYDDVIFGCVDTIGPWPVISHAPPGSVLACLRKYRVPLLIASVVLHSRPFTLPHRQ